MNLPCHPVGSRFSRFTFTNQRRRARSLNAYVRIIMKTIIIQIQSTKHFHSVILGIMASNRNCNWSDFDYPTTHVVQNTHYFYQPCVTDLGERYNHIYECLACNRNGNQSETLRCSQFCDRFESVLPPIYGGISGLSALCCVGVFLTYFGLPRLRRSGYSSKVFLYRCV